SLLFSSSLVSGIFWFNNSAIYPFIASNLNLGISVLGVMSAGFLAGVGLIQIPTGLLAMRIGMKDAILVGTAISSLATFATALVSDPLALEALRFAVGAGLALMFTPGVSLVASYYPHGREGFGVGVYDSFSLTGGIFAYIGDVLLASSFGWRATLEIDAAAGFAVGLAFFLIIPREKMREDFSIHVPKVRNVFLDSWLLTVGFSLLGLEFASALVGNFMVYFLSSGLKESALFAGIVGSVLPAAGVASSAYFGRIFDRTKKTKLLILSLGVLSAAGLAISALNTLSGSVLSTLMVGYFSSAGFIVCVAAARKLSEKHEMEYEVLGVSWVITMSLVGSFFGPIFFSFAVISFGYVQAWIFSGLISIGFFAPLIVSMTRRYPNARVV
ncbi:MAG TPA: MFS transporter, partial [Nitrososphaerales archaeon]|nr:MFS transporter [Nitrososphaerales archaeon]